jgi:5-methylcytosine-specific restriction endonuclease McrA
MSWLRIDDGFAQHPKLQGWTPAQKWALVEIFCYCARHKTEGHVPNDLALLPRGVTAKVLTLAEESGFLDRTPDGFLAVHDWSIYNPSDATAAERMRRWRARTPTVRKGKWEAARTQVYERDQGKCVDCGTVHDHWHADHQPPRDVLGERGLSIYDISYIVTRCPSCHAKVTRKAANEKRTQTKLLPNENGPSRARDPVPSLEEPESKDSVSSAPRKPNEIWDALAEVFGEPSTDTARSLRGKVCASLTRAGATPDELIARAKSWPRHFENATLTETALEKHWDKLGRPPLRAAR